jgi:hypothetical protein
MNPLIFEEYLGWLDNSKSKKQIQKWLVSDRQFSIFTVDSSQQLMDLSKWIKNNTSRDTAIGEFITQSDTPNMKSYLLKKLVKSLESKNLQFNNYYSKLDQIDSSETPPINCMQESTVKSTFAGTKIGDINQEITINIDLSPEHRRETCIEELHDSFIDDLSINGSNVLLLIRFGADGLNSLNLEFQNWFIDRFCRNTILQSNIKICILNEGDLRKICFEDVYQENFGHVEEEVFLKEAEMYVPDAKVRDPFFIGLTVFNEHKPIPYEILKRALIELLLSTGQRVEYDP